MIDNIKSNTINEVDTKKKINELNEIKKIETKGKRLIKSQEKLVSLFDDLKTIFNNNNNNSNENESENENDNENERDDGQYYLEQINDNFKNINETRSFKDH